MVVYKEKALRTELGALLNLQDQKRREYNRARHEKPFEKYDLDRMRNEIQIRAKEIVNKRQELESYQLPFRFGS